MVFATKQRYRRRALVAAISGTALLLAACGGGKDAAAPDSAATGSGAPAASNSTAAPTSTAASAAPAGTPGPTKSLTENFTNRKVGVGRLLQTQLKGKKSDVSMKVWVWLPPQYDDPAYANKKFPVLMGYPGGEGIGYTQWFEFGQPELIAKGGEYTPMIIVEPELQVSIKMETECADVPTLPKVDTFMTVDVVDMVKENFRVLEERTAWGLAGASTGAYCAARYVLAYPEKFSIAGMFSPYFTMDSNVPAANTPAVIEQFSPSRIIKRTQPDVKMLAFVGDKGKAEMLSAKYTADFAASVKPPTKFEVRKVPGGGHDWKTYEKNMPAMMKWLSDNLDKPK